MSGRSWFSIGVGVVSLLLFVSLGAVLAQETPAAKTPLAETPAAETPGNDVSPEATPTIDRLAAPPPVLQPSQADNGAYLYWVWCQPCHGDQGQGLTDEWREQYPEEDQYCWNRQCHGNIPYEDGFTLPKHIPAIIGEQSLLRFQTMEEVYDYTRVKMPFEFPGALDAEKALAVTAYLARENGKWDATRLTEENISEFRWQPLPTPTPPSTVYGFVKEALEGEQGSAGRIPANVFVLAVGLLIGLAILGGVYLWRRHHQ